MNKHCLDDQLCFKLYAVSRQVTNMYRPLLETLDITYPQYLVMLILWECKNSTVRELGKRLYLDSGTLTPLLKRLEQKDLLSRKRDPADERSVIVALTSQGETLKQKAEDIPEKMGKCFSMQHSEYLQLREQLEGLLNNLATS